MSTVVFLGPTLTAEEAQAILPCHVRPPVRRGDIAALMDDPPDVIAIIDGYFEQVPSVWHKEILFAISSGVKVAGASSMGALRAAELAQFGMVGVGKVFDAYRTGRFDPFDDAFEDDDEVAIVHGPKELGYLASVPLVDMRATFAAAVDAQIIGFDTAQQLVGGAKSVFFKDRSYHAVLSQSLAVASNGRENELEDLAGWLPHHRVEQKRADAIALLEALSADRLVFNLPAFRFEPTLLWERWQQDRTLARP